MYVPLNVYEEEPALLPGGAPPGPEPAGGVPDGGDPDGGDPTGAVPACVVVWATGLSGEVPESANGLVPVVPVQPAARSATVTRSMGSMR